MGRGCRQEKTSPGTVGEVGRQLESITWAFCAQAILPLGCVLTNISNKGI